MKGFADETTGHPRLGKGMRSVKKRTDGLTEDNDGASGKKLGHREDT